MYLSRSRKLVLFGVALLATGIAGRASADETSKQPAARPPAVQAGPAPANAAAQTRANGAAAAPATSAARPPTTSAARPPAAAAAAARPKSPAKGTTKAKVVTGPAGARMITGKKGVALTFDDGPDPVQTPRILKVLADHKVKATFCLVGANVKRHPDLVKKIVAGGHTLCNHTWNHSLTIGKASPAKIKADLARTNAAIRKAVPGARIAYFRAPGGNFTPRLVSAAKGMGMASIYWKVDPRDWHHSKGESHAQHQHRLIARVTKQTRAGAIVLSHDYGQPDTIVAYRKIIPYLKKRYQLIAL